MTELVTIPLFPLPIVLFPGEGIPLHIFEARYKELIADIEHKGALAILGICRAHQDTIEEYGCAAQLERITKRYDDGRLDIIVRGVKRFRSNELFSKKAYLETRAEFYEDSNTAPIDLTLKERAMTLHARLTELATGRPTLRDYPESVPLSFALGALAGLDIDSKQKLLLITDENERLTQLCQHYADTILKIEQQKELKRVTQSNGHYKH